MIKHYTYLLLALLAPAMAQASHRAQNVSLMNRKSPEFIAALEKAKADVANEYPKAHKKINGSALHNIAKQLNYLCRAQPVITGALVGLASGAIHNDYIGGTVYGASAGCVVSMYTKPQSSNQVIGSIVGACVGRSNHIPSEHFTCNHATALGFVIHNAGWSTMDYFFGATKE